MSASNLSTNTTTTREDSREQDDNDLRERMRNNVRRLREDRLLSKAELARRAGVSPLTVDRIESGKPCRMDTKRKIILALGMTIDEKDQVFLAGDEDETGKQPG
jgi:DNA-binding XRE family transcriptional regulator